MSSYFDYLPPKYRNSLTNLPNRRIVKKRLDTAIETTPGQFAFLQLDVDGLKDVNDTYGHLEGDEFLRTTAAVLEDTLRENDFLPAHISGDEFSVIIHDIKASHDVASVRERIRRTLADYGIEVSIGGRIHQLGETAVDLAKASDALMYKDKIHRKIERYDSPEIRKAVYVMSQLALKYGIPPRDVSALITLTREGAF